MLPNLALATAPQRVALVIGNSNYAIGQLANPANDATLMADTLEKLGFTVTKLLDGTLEQMRAAVTQFGTQLGENSDNTVGLVYYAGHGIQRDGKNFLIPVDAKINSSKDLILTTFDAANLYAIMDNAGNRLNFVIFDACRNDPFPKRDRSGKLGLARIEVLPSSSDSYVATLDDEARGTLIAYATAPDEVAQDGKGKNSPYAEALAHSMLEPNLAVERMFRHVRNKVMQTTANKQVPWESSSLIGKDYFFNPGIGQPQPTLETPISPALPSRARSPNNLSFHVNFSTRPAKGGTFRQLTDGDSLASGDLYKILIRPEVESYVYIFQVGATGHIDRLFPMVEFSGHRLNNVNPMQPRVTYFLPAKNKAFKLDATTGKEAIYVFVSPQPRTDIETLTTELASATTVDTVATDHATTQLKLLFKSRDLPLIATAAKPGVPKFSFTQDGQVVKTIAGAFKSNCDTCVYVLEFNHR